MSDPFSTRPATPAEAAEEKVFDTDGAEIPLFVVTCDGDDVSGPLTATYIERILDLKVQA